MSFTASIDNVILTHPLRPFIDTFKSKYNFCEHSTDSIIQNEAEILQSNRTAVKMLLCALINHPVSRFLQINPNLSLDEWITSIFTRLTSRDLELPIFRVLATSIVESDSDSATWKSIMQFCDEFLGMPEKLLITGGASKWQNSQGSFFQEVRESTYVKVDGFWEKFFSQGEYKKQGLLYLKSLSEANDGDPLRDFPKELSEETLWKWLDSFQQRYLDQAHNSPVGSRKTESNSSNEKRNQASRGKYFRMTRIGNIPGKQCHRQLDVFTKSRSCPAERPHHWRDVQVVGVLTNSLTHENWRDKFFQLAYYMRDLFYAQPLRRFAHGFLLYGTQLRLWVFDPCGAFGSGVIDIKEEPECFIRAITAYALMNEDKLGMNIFVNPINHKMKVQNHKTLRNNIYQLDINPFVNQKLPLSCGTVCYRTIDGEYIAKFSWSEQGGLAETNLHSEAQIVPGVTKLIGSQVITSTNDTRRGLDFKDIDSDTYKPNVNSNSDQESNMIQGEENKWKFIPELYSRTLECHCMTPAGRPLKNFKSSREFLTAMRDITKAHRQLYQETKILYCDIHDSNMILTDPEKNNGITGMLINFSQALSLNERWNDLSPIFNIPYIAPHLDEQLENPTNRTYRHDLESLFYIFLSVCMEFGWGGQQPSYKSTLFKSDAGKYRSWKYVRRDITDGFERKIVENFLPEFDCAKDLARTLKSILFSDYSRPSLGTPDDSNILYSPIIEAYEKALQDLHS
ncbi:BgtA-20289 [Blumeria graminis f. sp. tritici]|uniref:BgtA-20289 n=2 Tax=Blumeria graminis f. sp. tritici TaxID=62690 RepID=A0A9X9MM22_BLUGR|nr:hypothetical protein BGT96224_A20289 [Blumeria graminis f. sp. tritici 96224]VDB91241.1 BgtA-20289 [Blumeria graminis f. sp. tritici]